MKYISLELAKKLAEHWCELESEKAYVVSCWMLLCLWKRQSDDDYPAYDILNDICCKYESEFFWEDQRFQRNDDNSSITETILNYLQQWKKKLAEDYIWEHCLFNKKDA